MTTHYDKPLTKLIEDRAKELGRPFRTKEMVEHIIGELPALQT